MASSSALRALDPAPRRAVAPDDLRVRPLSMAAERSLAVASAFSPLLPAGLPRGVTVRVTGPAACSAAFALLGRATEQGSWVALAGMGSAGWQAAAELGVDLGRVVAVHPVPPEAWGATLAALVDGFDAVLVGHGHAAGSTSVSTSASIVRRLAARARERGTVVVAVPAGDDGGGGAARRGTARPRPAGQVWGDVSDIEVTTSTDGWEGLEDGAGVLWRRRVQVGLDGRRVPGRHRRCDMWLPGPDGSAVAVEVAASRPAHQPPSSGGARPGGPASGPSRLRAPAGEQTA